MTMELPVGVALPWEISYPPSNKDIGGCLENPKKEVVDKRQCVPHKRIAEEVFAEFEQYGNDSSTQLLVWKGQPNEEEEEEDDRQKKRCKSSCSPVHDGECSEGARVVGWPPIGSWRKKLVYQCRVRGQVGNVDNVAGFRGGGTNAANVMDAK